MYFLICSIMFRSCKVRSKDAVMILKKLSFWKCIMYFLICSIMFRSCKVRSKDVVMIKKIKFLEMNYVFLSMFHHVP